MFVLSHVLCGRDSDGFGDRVVRTTLAQQEEDQRAEQGPGAAPNSAASRAIQFKAVTCKRDEAYKPSIDHFEAQVSKLYSLRVIL